MHRWQFKCEPQAQKLTGGNSADNAIYHLLSAQARPRLAALPDTPGGDILKELRQAREAIMATGRSAKEVMEGVKATALKSGFNKYTVQPTGIWARINGWLAVDPKRSTGVPLNPQFRNPTPGGNDPKQYDDPTTVPAADLAENPYWKRDVRRSYPKLSVVRQPDVVALLSVGSAKSPKEDVLQIGDAGNKQLVAVKEEGEKGLSAFFEKDKSASKGVLGPDGLPPLPAFAGRQTAPKKFVLVEKSEQPYPEQYPCRVFI